jgi:hypothetical protein
LGFVLAELGAAIVLLLVLRKSNSDKSLPK